MLIELKVTNFAIIENLHIQFKKGLNILSGETGAGKSVLLKSLGLLMGQKASTESLRTGAQQASIEGSFDLSKRKDILEKLAALGVEAEDGVLVVRRVISEDKSRVYLNDTLSTLQGLRDVVSPLIEVAGSAAPLIEMTGQHENRNLLSTSYHLDLLDQHAGTWDVRNAYSQQFQSLKKLQQEQAELRNSAQINAQRLDYLLFQKNEISALELSPGEEIEIEVELKRLKNSSRITSFVESAEQALYSDDDSALTRLHSVLQKATDVAQYDPILQDKVKSLEQAKSLIEDVMYDLQTYSGKIEGDPQKLEHLQERLSDIRKLQKKYGATSEVILAALAEIEVEISKIENSDSRLEKIAAEISKIEKDLWRRAQDLHKKRQQSGRTLETAVNEELLDLNMKGVKFHVEVAESDQLSNTGLTLVEFMSQTSSKDAPKPLAKFSSGGELSRILLSLKRVVGSSHQPRTYLFDEVDTGVSGPTAEKVGKKLKAIAKGQQVVCVTHLPQVAAFGDSHFYIQKSPARGSVQMKVVELEKSERVQEIARLISGEKISKTSVAHAEQLLKEARP